MREKHCFGINDQREKFRQKNGCAASCDIGGRGRVCSELEDAHKETGGINTGSGFKDPPDMPRSIPLWRSAFEKGRLVSAMISKLKGERFKMVAYAANTRPLA